MGYHTDVPLDNLFVNEEFMSPYSSSKTEGTLSDHGSCSLSDDSSQDVGNDDKDLVTRKIMI